MKKTLISCMLILFSSVLFAASSTVNNVVFFGDSLTDDGNCYKVFKIIPKSPPYYKGRFTNGITWAEHLGQYLYEKNLTGYKNYSVGGAETIRHSFKTDKFISPMLLEIEVYKYLSSSDAENISNTLFLIWMGANDYLYEKEPNKDKVTTDVVNKMGESIVKLLDSGAMHLVIMNLPNLSLTPYAKDNNLIEELYITSNFHNNKLKNSVNNIKSQYPNKITFINVESIFYNLLDNPNKYNEKYNTNIKDTNTMCWEGTVLGRQTPSKMQIILEFNALNNKNNSSNLNSQSLSDTIINSPVLALSYNLGKEYKNGLLPCSNPNEHVFWDTVHPTAAVHKILGNIVIDLLEEKHLI